MMRTGRRMPKRAAREAKEEKAVARLARRAVELEAQRPAKAPPQPLVWAVVLAAKDMALMEGPLL